MTEINAATAETECSCGMKEAHTHIGHGKICVSFPDNRMYLEREGGLKSFETILAPYAGQTLFLILKIEEGGK